MLVHEVQRHARLLRRHLRHSRWALGAQREAVIARRLTVLFRDVNRYLRGLGVEYWINYGTLLGYHRGGGLLPGDRDVDFGAHEREFQRVWERRAALPPGFSMHDTSPKHRGPKLYVAYEGWEADIYFYEDRGEVLASYERSHNPGDVAPFPRDFVYPRQEVTLLAERTWAPAQIEAWLRHTYGYIGEDAVRDRRTGYWRPR